MTLSRRAALSLLGYGGLAGCDALTAVSKASDPLDTYTLTPLAPSESRPGGSKHLVVELPTAGGALATDRILIKPTPLQAQYLPDARWSDPAPALVQTLLVNSFLNRGGFRLVGRVGAGLMPDYTLMTEIQAFQAELDGHEPGKAQVRVLWRMTLISETNLGIAGTRGFTATTAAASDSTLSLIAAYDAAVGEVLAETVAWVEELT